jgi:hypothetical protein
MARSHVHVAPLGKQACSFVCSRACVLCTCVPLGGYRHQGKDTVARALFEPALFACMCDIVCLPVHASYTCTRPLHQHPTLSTRARL